VLYFMQDIQQLHMRLSAQTTEQRELKNRWLQEKTDLDNRYHQAETLSTQLQGTLKKKDKDFDKLQSQLAKIVKDGNKGQAKPCIQMSQPVRKNLSHDTASASHASVTTLLKDAEIQASKKTIATLDVR
jgi:chromosome segregation ATPase